MEASTQTGRVLLLGGPTSGSCPSGAFPLPLAFASQVAWLLFRTHATCPYSRCRNTYGVQHKSQPYLYIQPLKIPRRSFMSLSLPNNLPVSTKQRPTRMQTRPETSNCSGELGTKTVRLTVNLPADLANRMRDAVYWTPGLTLAWFVASAIRTSLTELETVNRAPFPKRARQLRPGRPRLMGQSLKLYPRFAMSGRYPLTESSSSTTSVSRSTHE